MTHQRIGDQRRVTVALPDGQRVAGSTSEIDFEEALRSLRASLEAAELVLLCNRFRADAFVSSMSRQMTDGLGCYIVKPNSAVDPSLLVEALAPAPEEKVSTSEEAEEYIANWIRGFE